VPATIITISQNRNLQKKWRLKLGDEKENAIPGCKLEFYALSKASSCVERRSTPNDNSTQNQLVMMIYESLNAMHS
jgi:hypothetical protein